MVQFAEYPSPVGKLLLLSDGEALTGLYLDTAVPENAVQADSPVLRQTAVWLDKYFRGEISEIDIPMNLKGTSFQMQVWQLLLSIPYGEVRSYGELAREMATILGKERMSAQAVGQAVGSNPISILIPCHRVVGAKGKLTGYAWGLEKKIWLLEHEKAARTA